MSHELTVRLAKLDAVEATDPVEREQARLSAVFAGTLTVLPRFTPANGADLQRTWNASAALQGGDADAAHTWLSRHSMVREGTGRLADVARLRRALDLTAADDPLVVGQLPVPRSGSLGGVALRARARALPAVACLSSPGERCRR